jgi:hypothetical protein
MATLTLKKTASPSPPREAPGPHAVHPRPESPDSPSPQAGGVGDGSTSGNFSLPESHEPDDPSQNTMVDAAQAAAKKIGKGK